MSEKRVFGEDTVKIDHRNFVEDSDPVFGPITVFKDVVIASEIIHPYDDGNAYKPADELEQAYWTWNNRWAISGDHPKTGIVSRRGDVHGRTVNLRFVKNLMDHKTERPNRRGVLADLQVFNKKVSPEILSDMKEGVLTDVSIGFFFTMDASPGAIEEDGHPLNGQEYDYIQRNFMGDHTAFGIIKGRCTMPYCGIGADQMMAQITGDPLGKYKDFADCVSKNQDKDDPEAYCGSIEHKIKEAKKKKDIKDTPDNIHMSDALEEVKVSLRDLLSKLDALESAEEEEIVEDTPPTTEDAEEEAGVDSTDDLTEEEDCPDCEEEQDAEEVPPIVETAEPFDVEASQRVTERTRAKIRELEL